MITDNCKKMSQQTVAYRYAKSLLDLAIEKKVEDKVYEDMKLFNQVCDDNHQFYLLLKSPIVSHFDKLTILQKIFTGKVDAASMSIFEIITKKTIRTGIDSSIKSHSKICFRNETLSPNSRYIEDPNELLVNKINFRTQIKQI